MKEKRGKKSGVNGIVTADGLEADTLMCDQTTY
jgi:hypothetical protein